MSEIETICAADCPPLDEKVASSIERAYRRGFHQGAYEVRHLQREGARDLQIDQWIERVYSWRLRVSAWRVGKLVKWEFPPQLKLDRPHKCKRMS